MIRVLIRDNLLKDRANPEGSDTHTLKIAQFGRQAGESAATPDISV
jgi:hypothetical protein